MQRLILPMILLSAALSLTVLPVPAVSQPVVANPLIEEMMTLDKVYREVVSAVSLGDSKRVHKALESMHGTMEKTHEGVGAGTVTIPKNAARVKEFVKMDRNFHEQLESLARAAHHDNKKEMLRITKQLLDGCVRCHGIFRK